MELNSIKLGGPADEKITKNCTQISAMGGRGGKGWMWLAGGLFYMKLTLSVWQIIILSS